MTEEEFTENNEILAWNRARNPSDIAMVEMGNNDVTLSCTLGKINLWFGRQSTIEYVSAIINSIAKIDFSVEHEKEVLCDFNEIAEYENKGCTVVSYAKNRGGGYRAIFTIPFYNPTARTYLINSIMEELGESDVRKTLHWNGNIAKIVLLFKELKKIPNFTLHNVKYKEELEVG
jgi:hypothetical protein